MNKGPVYRFKSENSIFSLIPFLDRNLWLPNDLHHFPELMIKTIFKLLGNFTENIILSNIHKNPTLPVEFKRRIASYRSSLEISLFK